MPLHLSSRSVYLLFVCLLACLLFLSACNKPFFRSFSFLIPSSYHSLSILMVLLRQELSVLSCCTHAFSKTTKKY
uniref:Putative secreted protein n=1 Tax=Anopheles darlingi TaxID=43151 RepID=A0A2M4DAR3_ANODA